MYYWSAWQRVAFTLVLIAMLWSVAYWAKA